MNLVHKRVNCGKTNEDTVLYIFQNDNAYNSNMFLAVMVERLNGIENTFHERRVLLVGLKYGEFSYYGFWNDSENTDNNGRFEYRNTKQFAYDTYDLIFDMKSKGSYHTYEKYPYNRNVLNRHL